MKPLFTIGHSTRRFEELLALLREHAVQRLVDVRRYPGSRRSPQFGRESLRAALEAAGIAYRHEPDLGGRRAGGRHSPNTAWRDPSFRAYADYTATPPFRDALSRVLAEAQERPTAVMCAEAHPSRCHRRLIADAAVARGVPVRHILGPGSSEPHVLHPAARVSPDGTLTWPDPQVAEPKLPGLDGEA
jgi:uncharacterized protein (DUF488 family)